jgi:hypothetical protein
MSETTAKERAQKVMGDYKQLTGGVCAAPEDMRDLIELELYDAVATRDQEWCRELKEQSIFCTNAPSLTALNIEVRLRAAVAAERERCAEVDPLSVRCPFPLCQSKVGEPCWNGDANYPEDGIHFSRFAAALRKEPA